MLQLFSFQYKQALSMIGLHNKTKTSFNDQDMISCPFHSDHNPSCSVNFQKGIYHCFQCGKKGTISSLVWELQKESIYTFLGIERDEGTIIGYKPLQKTIKEVKNEEIKPEEIKKKPISLDIRGLISPYDQWETAIQYLNVRGIPENIAKENELMYSEEVTINGTFFKKRILIPIYDENNILVNFEGRDISFNKDVRKVLYPKKSIKPLYQFNKLDLSKPVFLFEGILKTLVARTDFYFKNSTSLLGVEISELQVNLLKRIPHIIVIPDNDEAGKKLVPFLRKNLEKTIIECLRIKDTWIKDADEIPKKSGISVQQYREAGGFVKEVNYDFGEYY
jgi:DNA primase